MAKRKLDTAAQYINIFGVLAKTNEKDQSPKKESSVMTNPEFEEVSEIPVEIQIINENKFDFDSKEINGDIPLKLSQDHGRKTEINSISPDKLCFKNTLLKSVVPDSASRNKLLYKKKNREYSPPNYVFPNKNGNSPFMDSKNKDIASSKKPNETLSMYNCSPMDPAKKERLLKEYMKSKGNSLAPNNMFYGVTPKKQDNNFIKKHEISKIKESTSENDEEEKCNFNEDEMNENSKF